MPLKGIKVVEMMGVAPGPFCGSILADFGALVTIVQKTETMALDLDVMSNGKEVISVDLKTKKGKEIVKKLCAASDVVLDVFRPGVMEKLGLGPEILTKDNPRLIYARLTGYGQDGIYKDKAGHDINFYAMSGILSMVSTNGQPPIPPVNLYADFAGGSLLCTFGVMLALFNRTKTGKGQIMDSSITEGAAYAATWLFKSFKLPIWSGKPGQNVLDGGLPYYNTYKTKDGKFMAVGAAEPKFYRNFLNGLQLSEEEYDQNYNPEATKNKFQEIFLMKTQEEWCQIFKDIDACVTPVLELNSVDKHACHVSRKSFYRDADDVILPEPVPKLSQTPGKSVGYKPMPKHGQHTIKILQELGYKNLEIKELVESGVVYANKISNL